MDQRLALIRVLRIEFANAFHVFANLSAQPVEVLWTFHAKFGGPQVHIDCRFADRASGFHRRTELRGLLGQYFRIVYILRIGVNAHVPRAARGEGLQILSHLRGSRNFGFE